MADLVCGALIIALLSLMLFLLGLVIGRAAPRWVTNVLGILTIVGMAFYIGYLWDNILLARLLPYSNLIVLGNWFPLAAGFLGGLAWRQVYGGKVRKALYVTALLGASAYAVVFPLRGSPPPCQNVWYGSICIQTSDQTCSAACAATLLVQHDIPATEQEMAELCLTRQGTNWQGLYRGLKLKTDPTAWDVEVFDGDVDHLKRSVIDGPMILSVGIPRGAEADSDYVTRHGWRPGRLHSVILIGFYANGHAVIADPSLDVPIELWTEADLRTLFRGRGLQLVERAVQ